MLAGDEIVDEFDSAALLIPPLTGVGLVGTGIFLGNVNPDGGKDPALSKGLVPPLLGSDEGGDGYPCRGAKEPLGEGSPFPNPIPTLRPTLLDNIDALGGGSVSCTSAPSLTAWATATRLVAVEETLFRRVTRCIEGFVPRE